MTTSTGVNEFRLVAILSTIILSMAFSSQVLVLLLPIAVLFLNGVRDNFASSESLMSECCVIGWVIVVEFLLFAGILTLSFTLSLASTQKSVKIFLTFF